MYPQEMIDPPYEEPVVAKHCTICGGEICENDEYWEIDCEIMCSEDCVIEYHEQDKRTAEPFDAEGYLADLAYEMRVDKELRGA